MFLFKRFFGHYFLIMPAQGETVYAVAEMNKDTYRDPALLDPKINLMGQKLDAVKDDLLRKAAAQWDKPHGAM